MGQRRIWAERDVALECTLRMLYERRTRLRHIQFCRHHPAVCRWEFREDLELNDPSLCQSQHPRGDACDCIVYDTYYVQNFSLSKRLARPRVVDDYLSNPEYMSSGLRLGSR